MTTCTRSVNYVGRRSLQWDCLPRCLRRRCFASTVEVSNYFECCVSLVRHDIARSTDGVIFPTDTCSRRVGSPSVRIPSIRPELGLEKPDLVRICKGWRGDRAETWRLELELEHKECGRFVGFFPVIQQSRWVEQCWDAQCLGGANSSIIDMVVHCPSPTINLLFSSSIACNCHSLVDKTG